MVASAIGESFEDEFLLTRFRAFYAALADCKRRVQQAGWTDPGAVFRSESARAAASQDQRAEEVEDEPLSRAGRQGSSAEAIARELQAILERDALEAARLGGSYGAGLYREAQYLMAALADEIFLNELDWQDRSAWQRTLLEYRLFNSSVAGDQVFKRIDRVLTERDPVLGELAILYLLVLSAGFRGKYRGVDDAGQIDRYKRELFQFVARRKPQLTNAERKLFKAAYREPHRGEERVRLPYLRPWLLAIAGFLLLYLLVSIGLWEAMTLPLDDVLGAVR